MMRITPKMIVNPMPMRAYTPPIRIPADRAEKYVTAMVRLVVEGQRSTGRLAGCSVVVVDTLVNLNLALRGSLDDSPLLDVWILRTLLGSAKDPVDAGSE